MRKLETWLSDEQLDSIYTSSYWNNIDEEKKKPWWIEAGDYAKCLDYLESSRLLFQYRESEKFIGGSRGNALIVADLAAGIGWTSALLSKLPQVSQVHAVEISKHRLGPLFEHSVKMLAGEESKIFRHLGSFYDLHFENNSIDLIYLSQAFHHADKPLRLLVECDRVLKNKGRIVLVGEHYIGAKRVLRRFLLTLLRRKKLTTDFYELFPPDEVLGDHYYRRSDYYFMFGAMGYDVRHQALEGENVIYVADKRA